MLSNLRKISQPNSESVVSKPLNSQPLFYAENQDLCIEMLSCWGEQREENNYIICFIQTLEM